MFTRFRPEPGRDPPVICLGLENPDFGGPVRERQAEATQIGVPRSNERFDFRDLAATVLDSFRTLPLDLDLFEAPAVCLELGLSSG